VTKLAVTCTETTAGQVSVQLIKRDRQAESGGTAATVTNVPLDSNKAAASSVVNSYTGTGPTVGTSWSAIWMMRSSDAWPLRRQPRTIFTFQRFHQERRLRFSAEQQKDLR
jgi:hypothetical protein